jgi:sporulation protein YlmC with PRC-barrel domain
MIRHYNRFTAVLIALIALFLFAAGANAPAARAADQDQDGQGEKNEMSEQSIDQMSMVGKEIRSSDGDTIGSVENFIVLRSNGRPRVLIVASMDRREDRVVLAIDRVRNTKLDYVVFEGDVNEVGELTSYRAVTENPGEYAEFEEELTCASFMAKDLIGRSVKNTEGETIGDVQDIVIHGEKNRENLLVIGVGGFLGLGEKSVAVPMSWLLYDNAKNVVYNVSRKELEDQKKFDRDFEVECPEKRGVRKTTGKSDQASKGSN